MPNSSSTNETTATPKQLNQANLDFVCGIISVLGQFNWYNNNGISMPIFQIRTNVEELPLLDLIQSVIGLPEKPRIYQLRNRKFCQLVVRRLDSIKTVIDKLDQRLIGHNALVFDNWRDKYYQKMLRPLYDDVSRETL